MASEYLKWKYRDVKPEEKRELTKKEKWRNWWYYNKWNVIGGLIAFLVAGNIFITASGILKKKPDIQIALITKEAYAQTELDKIQSVFENIADDYNNDGTILVQINSYVVNRSLTDSAEETLRYTEEVRIASDLDSCESFLFLMDDPEDFQQRFSALCLPDGTVSEETYPAADCVYAWSDLSVLNNSETENDSLLQCLSIGRRGFWTSKTVRSLEDCVQFWQMICQSAE